MNGVAFSARLSAVTCADRSAGSSKGIVLPRYVCMGGRGRSSGSSRSSGRPASSVFQ